MRFTLPQLGQADTGKRLQTLITMSSTAIATLPSTSMPILGAKGRQLGTRYFVGTACAKTLKATGKTLGLKGSALKDYVNAALTDESAARAATVAATVSALASKGFVADTVDVRKNSAQIKFIKTEEVAKPISLAQQLVNRGKFDTLAQAEAFLA